MTTIDDAAALIEAAAPGQIEDAIERIAACEGFTPDELRDVLFLLVEDGSVVVDDDHGNFALA